MLKSDSHLNNFLLKMTTLNFKNKSDMATISSKYKYFCVIDFEATCIQGEKTAFYPHEIIEFPAFMIDTVEGEIVSSFHSYVKPVLNPRLTEFCKNLTGITQTAVDNSETFPDVLAKFQDWLNNSIKANESFVIVTDGIWDIHKFLNLQCLISKIEFPEYAYEWINIKSSFAYFNKSAAQKSNTLMDMLKVYDLKFTGRLHSGRDDAFNIARLTLTMLKRGCELATNAQLPNYGINCTARKLAIYLRDSEKRKRSSRPGNSKRRASSAGPPVDSSMDVDPDVVGSEYVILRHKKRSN